MNVSLKNIVNRITGLIAVASVVLLTGACGSSKSEEAQTYYLDAVKHRNEVQLKIEADPRPPWTELRTLSGEMKRAQEEELSKFESYTWPAEVNEPMTALKNDIRTSLPYWQKAAEAGTEKDVHANIELGLKYCGGQSATGVRAALGLPTS